MAKLRVYELARSLNTTNVILIDKIRDMGIPVKSHMTTFDSEMVKNIKANFLGNEQVLDEQRLKPTLIRRRRKKNVENEVFIEKGSTDFHEPQELSSVEKTDASEQSDIEDDKQELLSKEKPAEVNAEKKLDENIIESKMQESVGRLPDEEAVDNEPAADATNNKDLKIYPFEKKDSIPVTETKKRKKKTKKGKKDTPAKIIKLPEPVKKADRKPVKKLTASDTKPVAPIKGKVQTKGKIEKKTYEKPVKPSNTNDFVKKKKIKRPEKEEKEVTQKGINWSKKKISFKKKEVVEGDALYAKSKKKRKRKKGFGDKKIVSGQKTLITTPKAIKRRIKIDDTITLSDLARRMGIKANEMIAKLMTMGVMATVNQTIDFDTAALVAAEFKYELEKASFEEENFLKVEENNPDKMVPRAPVVTIMGHVDHGKTSLLDVIRKTNITATEAGGITQHIGAYSVKTDGGQVAFLDTPGHEAFTAMRSRGASITDMVILVVAADDGVMPQTVEAINHAKAANVSIIVAINKIDKPGAEPDRVKRELAEAGLVPEDWGGNTIFANVSAKTGAGIDNLLEMVLLQAEVLELKANPERLAAGHIIEANLDPGKGALATVLIQQGTLHAGDSVVCGTQYGKIRSLMNDKGELITSAGPSMPVEITGLTGVPSSGDELIAIKDEKSAKQISLHRTQKHRAKELAKTSKMSLEKLYEKLNKAESVDLNLIVKADVHGSIEAIIDSLSKLSNENVKINIIHFATGTVTESDISLAVVSDAIILGFNVRPGVKVRSMAVEEHVDLRFYNIIYNLIEDIQNAIIGMMPSTFKEHILGTAEIREVFHIPKIGAIAGCYVIDGKIKRNEKVRLLRDGIVIYEGKISSLKRFKDDAKEVQNGFECGIGIENYNDIKVNDTIECFHMEEIKAQAPLKT